MKNLERFGIGIMSLWVLFAAHQLVRALFNEHGWKGLSPSDWASWVQAVGSILAIGFAYVVGQRQAMATLQSVHNADKIAAQRKFDAVLAVADAARAYASESLKAFAPDRVSYLHLRMNYSERLMQNMMDALQVIPAHEIGSYRAVSALLTLRNAMSDLRGNLQRALDNFDNDDDGFGRVGVMQFDRTPIDLCLKKIDECVEALYEERDLFT